jgi:hypothetical protein
VTKNPDPFALHLIRTIAVGMKLAKDKYFWPKIDAQLMEKKGE